MKAGSSRDVREKKLHRVPEVILTLHHTSDHLSMAWYIVRKRVSIRPQRRIEMLLIYSVLFSYRGVRVKSLTSTTLRNAKVLINLTHTTRRVNNSEVPKTKRGGDQLLLITASRWVRRKDIDSRSEYAHSEKSPNSSLTYILH